tara:strand:+ start:372 stop:1172 length:801 start_codon:yes stop_codon:yes gene_type:complete
MKNYIDQFKLNKKKVLIIGGLGLIGFEISRACLSAGADIYIIDNNKSKINQAKKILVNFKKKYKIINLDTSNYKTIGKNYKTVINQVNKIDIFINASYPKDNYWKKNSFNDITLNSFCNNISMHMISYAWLPKLIADHMVRNKIQGSIILLSSIYGLKGQDLSIYKNTNIKENMTYSLIKGGINNFVRQMSSYYGKHNIRVNALCPGGVKDKSQNIAFIKNYSNKVPLKRLAKPSEIASCALFLSSEASSYITGTTLIVDGGWTAI